MRNLMKIISLFIALLATTTAQATDQAIIDRYNKSCVVCHASGVAGAPKTGVPQEWASRMAKGMDVLVQSAEKGLKAMPPKGMCYDCSSADFKALIEYMTTAK